MIAFAPLQPKPVASASKPPRVKLGHKPGRNIKATQSYFSVSGHRGVDFACRSTKLILYPWSACRSISGAGRFRVRVDFACGSTQLIFYFWSACGSISRGGRFPVLVNLWARNEYKGQRASEHLFKKIK